jgi:hypothetical protein
VPVLASLALAHLDVGAPIAKVDDVIDLDGDHLGQAQPGLEHELHQDLVAPRPSAGHQAPLLLHRERRWLDLGEFRPLDLGEAAVDGEVLPLAEAQERLEDPVVLVDGGDRQPRLAQLLLVALQVRRGELADGGDGLVIEERLRPRAQ